jgi:cell wall-associated NlpC family hydrolase
LQRLTALILLVLALVCTRLARAEPSSSRRAQRPARQLAREALGTRAVQLARDLLGVRYRYGGASPRTGFDCSGFVRFVYGHVGIHLPRVSYEQFSRGRRVARRLLRPGDLVFFDGAGHVGIYIGHGRFIHAPHSGTVVSIDSLWGSYGAAYDGARRIG